MLSYANREFEVESMAGDAPMGTVTSLASVFSADEARKAARRVRETIAQRKNEANQLERFIADNNAVLNLVQTLPDQLSYQIMVPFGKLAFFPGRLIHTNEFMVLLGDGYYAERTSKQTVEILHRRGKILESKVESAKATVMDLKAEASFFDSTACEASEGLMEIREDYVGEKPAGWKSESDPQDGGSENDLQSVNAPNSENDWWRTTQPQECTLDAYEGKVTCKDEEYARIMSRLDELEKEEEDASNHDYDDDFSSSKLSGLQINDKVQEFLGENWSNTNSRPSSQSYVQSDEASHRQDLSESSMMKSNVLQKPLLSKEGQVNQASKIKKVPIADQSKMDKDFGDETAVNRSANRLKAFTGSIVEHNHRLPSKPVGESSELPQVLKSSSPSKPVSRFKMQRGSH